MPVLLFAIATIVVSAKVTNDAVVKGFQIAMVSLFGASILFGFGFIWFIYRGIW